MRLACPKERGRIFLSFSRASRRRPGDFVIIYIIRQQLVFHAGKVLDLLELALYIALVFQADLRLIPHRARKLGALNVKRGKPLIAQRGRRMRSARDTPLDTGAVPFASRYVFELF